MKGFILAAGLGTRLKPWTDTNPKALVPVGGRPMLERVVEQLHAGGITDLTVNVHHFADKIRLFIEEKGWNMGISDETELLLETGGGLLNAAPLLLHDPSPILIHNVDILSNADFRKLEEVHNARKADITLLVSDRDSSRRLIFSPDWRLKGWYSLSSGEFRPLDFSYSPDDIEMAFSGIYVISPSVLRYMVEKGWSGKFPIMDFLLASIDELRIFGFEQKDLSLIDIGKPDSLNRAQDLFL